MIFELTVRTWVHARSAASSSRFGATFAVKQVMREQASDEFFKRGDALLGERRWPVVEEPSIPPSLDEPCSVQDFSVIGDGGLCEIEKVVKLGAGYFTLIQDELQDRQPRSVT